MSEQPSGEQPSRYVRSFGGLVGAIGVALVAILFVWGLTRFQHHDVANPAVTVDYAPELAQARQDSPFAVLAPSSLPTGWRATTVSWDGEGPEYAWHLGVLTGGDTDADYVGLEQGNAAPTDFIAGATPADQPGEPVQIAGQTWQTLTSSDGRETALVLNGKHVTTIVTGSAPESELEAYAASLTADATAQSSSDG